MDTILKAIGQGINGTCEVFLEKLKYPNGSEVNWNKACGKDASWLVDFEFLGEKKLCREHYRVLTGWECPECTKVNFGLPTGCECGWQRPDKCRKCGNLVSSGLIKLTKGVCKACNGSGKYICLYCQGTKCKQCNNTGFHPRWHCKECNGTGKKQKKSHSARWKVTIIDLNDILDAYPVEAENDLALKQELLERRTEVQNDLKPYVGQYICFRCAAPDVEPIFYRDELADKVFCPQCAKEDVRQNINSYNLGPFCLKHTDKSHCLTCDIKLRVDELGPYCRDHNQCNTCGISIDPSSRYCRKHQFLKGFGSLIDRSAGFRMVTTKGAEADGAVEKLETIDRVIDVTSKRADNQLRRARALERQIREMKENLETLEDELIEKNDELVDLERDLEELGTQPDNLLYEKRALENHTGSIRIEIGLQETAIKKLENEYDKARQISERYGVIDYNLLCLKQRLEDLYFGNSVDLDIVEVDNLAAEKEVVHQPKQLKCDFCGRIYIDLTQIREVIDVDPNIPYNFQVRGKMYKCLKCINPEDLSLAEKKHKALMDIISNEKVKECKENLQKDIERLRKEIAYKKRKQES